MADGSGPNYRPASFHKGRDFEAGRTGPPRGEEAPLGQGLARRLHLVKVRLCDFSGSLLVDEVVANELEAKRLHLLRRGRILTDEELVADEVDPGVPF